jgi:hypothetical protein
MKYEDVTDIVIVLEGTPTGGVLYKGDIRGIPRTRLDTFVTLYSNLLKQGRNPLGIITGSEQKGPIESYIKDKMMWERDWTEDSISLYKCDNTRITLEDAIEVKKFLLKENLKDLPCYIVTTEEHMRHAARKDFEKCFGDDIKAEYVSAPWGVTGLERIKAELHGVIARPLDALVLMNVEDGDYKTLYNRIEKFWALRKLVRKSQIVEGIGRRH